MNIVKNEFWATPVWEIDTGFDDYFNTILVNDIAEMANKGVQYNIWDKDCYSMNTLKETIFKCLDLAVKPYFPSFHPYNPQLIDGWGHRTKPGENLLLHAHPHVILVATYYAKVPKDSGDLLLVDPRGTINWDWVSDSKHPRTLNGVVYKRIEPTPGKLVIFPGYLAHMVDTNHSKEDRVSVAANIHNGSTPT